MPRHQYEKRQIKPDEVYHSLEVAKLVNYIMIDGKKKCGAKDCLLSF